MEQIRVWRPENTVDEDGNPTAGELRQVAQYPALVAPISVEEQLTATQTGITYDTTLYFRGIDTGIRASDVLEVRGMMVPVNGAVDHWVDADGSVAGDVVRVTLRQAQYG